MERKHLRHICEFWYLFTRECRLQCSFVSNIFQNWSKWSDSNPSSYQNWHFVTIPILMSFTKWPIYVQLIQLYSNRGKNTSVTAWWFLHYVSSEVCANHPYLHPRAKVKLSWSSLRLTKGPSVCYFMTRVSSRSTVTVEGSVRGSSYSTLWTFPPVGRNLSTQRKLKIFGRALTDSFYISVMCPQCKTNPCDIRGELKGACFDDCATETHHGWGI